MTAQSIAAYLEGKIAKWWMPDDVVFVEALSYGATGKIQKMELRRRFAGHYSAWRGRPVSHTARRLGAEHSRPPPPPPACLTLPWLPCRRHLSWGPGRAPGPDGYELPWLKRLAAFGAHHDGSKILPHSCWCSSGRPRSSTMWISPQCTSAIMIG